MAIRIVTDSTADIPADLAERLGLFVVPMPIMFGDEELRDGVDITTDQFFRRLVREQQLPTTSQPPSGVFAQAYETLQAGGTDGIVSIHLSGKLSGTVESARQAAQQTAGHVAIVDSGQVSVGLGLGVIAAAEAAQAGASLDEVKRVAQDVFDRTRTYILFDTLEYLRRGGRMGRGMEVVGTLLKVKPIATLEGGELVAAGRVRTRAKAVEDLLRRVAELRPIERAAAAHATTPQDLDYIVNRLRGIAPDADVLPARITPALGAHGGPGVLGVAVVAAPRSNNGGSPAAPAT
ncbi:MAG: DegV family EDD domain-containing protein [Dehalococcoidia bacterium]|nr:DegV family EDD domain-containing protein [Dehalococcoidia bacterium]